MSKQSHQTGNISDGESSQTGSCYTDRQHEAQGRRKYPLDFLSRVIRQLCEIVMLRKIMTRLALQNYEFYI